MSNKQADSEQIKEKQDVKNKSDLEAVKAISMQVQHDITHIQHENLQSFRKAGTMYYQAFLAGLCLIGAGFSLAVWTITTSNSQPNITMITGILSGIFGVGGIIDITMLLFRPARDLQRSRASASQLAMATNEWQFISVWSGKTIHSLYKKLETQQCDSSCINAIKELLVLKERLCSNLINEIEQTVANENVKEAETVQPAPKSLEIEYDIEITDQDKLKSITNWVKIVNEKANETYNIKDKEFIKITDDKKKIIVKFVDENEKKSIIDAIEANKTNAEKIDPEFYKKLLEKVK
ncbi:MAG TPA: hypothetical protein VLF17_07780 [Candidatus Nitrosotenuis sp.]|nr:hypothetical protein [Candidatus Nitrosotenuis sp.]